MLYVHAEMAQHRFGPGRTGRKRWTVRADSTRCVPRGPVRRPSARRVVVSTSTGRVVSVTRYDVTAWRPPITPSSANRTMFENDECDGGFRGFLPGTPLDTAVDASTTTTETSDDAVSPQGPFEPVVAWSSTFAFEWERSDGAPVVEVSLGDGLLQLFSVPGTGAVRRTLRRLLPVRSRRTPVGDGRD